MYAKSLILAMMLCTCFSITWSQSAQNRKPFAAGRFYSDNPEELCMHLQQLFSKTNPSPPYTNLRALLVPHAGYIYSGEVAAKGYSCIDPNHHFEHIFLIGTSHAITFKGVAAYCGGHFETPLGIVEVDQTLINEMAQQQGVIQCMNEPHMNEHSLEVQLPFLQFHLNTGFKIVPLLIGTSTPETAQKLAHQLKPYFNEHNLFIISSDFSHYPDQGDARLNDRRTAEAIKSNRAINLLNVLDGNRRRNIPGLATSLCGWSSVLTLLYLSEPDQTMNVELIDYQNSGDSPYGESDHVVGYWAIAFKEKGQTPPSKAEELSGKEKQELIRIARETITEYVYRKTVLKVDPLTLSPPLRVGGGVFVTLHKKGQLRGCIGHFEADFPLWSAVQKMAIAACSQDYRFSPVKANELNELTIELSVLSPLRRIRSSDEIILGKHGIYIRKGEHTGTFLPQVAAQTGWSREEFLGHCAQDKMGLGWNDWKSAELYVYEALIFGEEEPNK